MLINDDKLNKLIDLAQKGVTNRNIAVILGVKAATVSLWKRQLKEKGISTTGTAGRPRKMQKGVDFSLMPENKDIDLNKI